MTLLTKFVNKSTVDFKLKEGNAGVYRDVCILKGLESETGVPCEYQLDFDETATYREYMTVSRGVGRQPSSKIHISSQFCLNHSTIYIVPKPNVPGEMPQYEVSGDLRPQRPELRPWRISGLLKLASELVFWK